MWYGVIAFVIMMLLYGISNKIKISIIGAVIVVALVYVGINGLPSPLTSWQDNTSILETSGVVSSDKNDIKTDAASSYNKKISEIPAKPAVNREAAMTKEEAKRLTGTGYHGTRPNSSAEDMELKAAQKKCRNCGYRTHNGTNSLCDYCSWMQKYGGGLP